MNSLSLLRVKAFVIWPLTWAGLIILGWHFEGRLPTISWLVFAISVWILFFRVYRAQIRLRNYRCPHCGELFFRRDNWLVRPINVWSNRCINCLRKAS